ncbi:hypothetical protein QTG54_014004 [Skeletonema marinoi]|uniref:CENP-V/GFA domain-containing protein n=1 Tax=Skeletonema marinoi TaxID=267567 RepID=A0AAD9D755_9STRA|nr:hypothetical protein QTG54_014004 [Skeletonema marinoi]
MVNNSISTTQSLDRLVGTAAIIGLSLAVVLQWLSAPSDENDVFEEDGSNQQQEERSRAAAAASPSRRKVDDNKSTSTSWWWPVRILMKRRKKKIRRKRINKDDDINDNIANHPQNLDESYKTNDDASSCDDGYCNHLGSCECGSIRFILKGPKHLQPSQSPGKMQYPHIRTSASSFHLLQGEADMRFQYVHENDEDNDNNHINNNNGADDSSTIATEHNEKQHASSLGAHVFCGNCGVHVMHADRSSEELEVNANCLLEEQEQQQSPVEEQQQEQKQQIQQQTSSMSSLSTIDGDTTTTEPVTSTRSQQQQQQQQLNSVSEHELFLGSAQFWGELDNNQSNITSSDKNKPHELESSQHARTESIASTGEQTHPESYTTMVDTPTYEGDDYSMDGSSSVTQGAMGGGGGASSVASLSVNAGLLPPLPPSRLPPLSSSSDSKSVRTLPPWFGERPGYASHPSRSVGGGWSVASMETNDLDSVGGESTTVSPRMRDQMKFYMNRHMKVKDKKKSERSGSV